MPNQIQLPTGIDTVVDEKYRAGSVFSILDSSPDGLRPTVNVNEFCYPQVEVGGLGDYSRNSGYTANSGVSVKWQTVKADYDRGTMLQIDDVDNQETFDIALAESQRTLIDDHVVPEADAWACAKLCAVEGISKANATFANPLDFLDAVNDAMAKMDEDEVPATERYMFVTSTLLRSVKKMKSFESKEVLDDFAGVLPVPQSRFVSAIDLKAGGEVGGWVKNPSAADLNFMIVHKPAVIKHKKHVTGPKVISPDDNQRADAYLVKFRTYGVCDVYKNKTAGIYVCSKTPIA